MFKHILPYLVLLVLSLSFPKPDWAAEAPIGFRGITWGTPLSELTGMVVANDSGQVKYYYRTGDTLNLGEAKLKRISYGFYRGQFYSVLLEFKDGANFEKAKIDLLSTYGEATGIGSTGTSYRWRTPDGTSVNLKYSKDTRQGHVFFFNRIVAQ